MCLDTACANAQPRGIPHSKCGKWETTLLLRGGVERRKRGLGGTKQGAVGLLIIFGFFGGDFAGVWRTGIIENFSY